MPLARILCVDDEPSIQQTLPEVLKFHGFDAHCVGSVAEALAEITSQNFDVLITDLNIGQPGDGFTVVSAMRRTQPGCINFILTGFPALETALQAIRSQVDGYLIKPANIRSLIAAIEEKLKNPAPQQVIPRRRLSAVLRERSAEIQQRALDYMAAELELASLPLSDEERGAPLSPVIAMLADVLDSPDTDHAASAISEITAKWVAIRYAQGFSIPMLILNARLLQRAIYDIANENLLSLNLDLSRLMPDLKLLSDTVCLFLQVFMRAFEDLEKRAA